MAGGESTANTLSFCLMYMAMYPDKQAKVHAELDAACRGPEHLIELSEKPKYVSSDGDEERCAVRRG